MKHFFLIASCLAVMACAEKNPVLTIEGGQIQGVLTDSSDVMVYKGIPYAAPPVGDLRWKAPQPVVAWEGVKIADEFGPIGIQTGNPPGTFYGDEFYWMGTPEQSEDCLYLNVWAPAKTIGKTDAGLPVAMWIHGGAYTNGFGHEVTMDGDAWAERGVILVTINYRLGVLGFLSHPELSKEQGGASGNYGMQDQIAALKWIHENIAQFGGNPDNITVLGQSAGAMSVKNLVASPVAKDMIAKAVIQSGGGLGGAALRGAGTQEMLDAQGKDFMDANDCETLEKMRAADGPSMLNFSSNYMAKTRRYVSFSPHNDPELLPEDFNAATMNGTLADIPYMIGSNSEDMGGLGGSAIDRFCEVRDSMSTQPAYKYYFSRNLPGDDEDPATDPGAFHSAELWYTFKTLKNSWRPFTEADYALSDEMVDAWTNFCRTGNPGWPEYTKENPYTMEFDIRTHELEDGSGPFKAVASEEPGLQGYTIYRPENMQLAKDAEGKLPVILFGNGGCAKNSWDFRNYLAQLASHGYVIIANGGWTPRTPWPQQAPQAPRNNGQKPAQAPSPEEMMEAMMAGFKAAEAQNVADAKDYLRALDWLEGESMNKESKYYKAVNTSNVAAMGQSCGGGQALILGASGDDRIRTTMPLNSGVAPLGDSYWMVDKEDLKNIRHSICYLCGGPTDVAYPNTEDDYSRISHIPVVAAHLPVGHGGTYQEKNGGSFADMALLWLDLQLKGKKENEDIFRNAKLPANLEGWEMKSKNWN